MSLTVLRLNTPDTDRVIAGIEAEVARAPKLFSGLPVLIDLNGGMYQGAEGAGFGMSTEDLKVWFGILALIVVELGLITPPVGMNVFVINSIARDISLPTIFRGVLPFVCADVLRLILLVAFPVLVLWLPRTMQ